MNFSKLDQFMSDMPARGYPACELTVAKDGKVVYDRVVGYSDAEGKVPAANKDIYWIFSASKVITCLAAMRLVGEGKIDIYAPVSRYIPEYASITVKKNGTAVPAERTMTVEHLFTMTGGLTYDINTPEIAEAKKNDPTTLGIARAIAKTPLVFEPGTHYNYSLCHDVLAAVVEVASGMRFSEYLERYIFKPLGIADMGFRPTEEQKSRFSAMYEFGNSTGLPKHIPTGNMYILTPDYDSGGAGLFATAEEYMKIISVVANGGVTDNGYVLIQPEMIKLMQQNRLCPEALDDFIMHRFFGYGFGLCGRAHIDPVRSLSRSAKGEFGWDGAASAYALIDPENRVAIYFTTHTMGAHYSYYASHPAMRDIVYEALSDR